MRLREADKEYAQATAEWRNATAVFSGTTHSINMGWIDAERTNIQSELDNTYKEAEDLEQKIFNAEVSDGLTLQAQDEVYQQVVKAQEELLRLKSERDSFSSKSQTRRVLLHP